MDAKCEQVTWLTSGRVPLDSLGRLRQTNTLKWTSARDTVEVLRFRGVKLYRTEWEGLPAMAATPWMPAASWRQFACRHRFACWPSVGIGSPVFARRTTGRRLWSCIVSTAAECVLERLDVRPPHVRSSPKFYAKRANKKARTNSQSHCPRSYQPFNHKCHLNHKCQWACRDSNPGPLLCESSALTS